MTVTVRRVFTLFALLAALTPGRAPAQVTTTGNIRVAVTDQDDLAVPGATVTAAAEDAATTRVAVTDTRGLAELAALHPSARYVVTVELQGFQAIRQEDFLVRAGQTASTAVSVSHFGNRNDLSHPNRSCRRCSIRYVFVRFSTLIACDAVVERNVSHHLFVNASLRSDHEIISTARDEQSLLPIR